MTSELVATFIAGHDAKLSALLMQDMARFTERLGATVIRTDWLDENIAADLFAAGIDCDAWRESLKKSLAGEPFDIIVQFAANRRKKILAADMESTIIEQELLDELAGEIGMHDQVAEITRRAMNGENDFAAALRARVALFDGQPVSILEKAAKRITIMPGAAQLVDVMKANGAKTYLITGGFSYFADPVAKKLDFDRSHANELVIENDKLTGEAKEPILDRNRKKELLEQACIELDLSPADCIAVGDGSNDVPMLNLCNSMGGLGVAYRAKPTVQAAVPHHINHNDLTALLYAQGYKKTEFSSLA